MKIFRIDGQPSRDDECEHGLRRFEKCPHCLADEIERLREALRQCYVLFNDARNGPPNLFKICCEGMRVVRAENVLGRGNG